MNDGNLLDLHSELQNDAKGERRAGLLARLRALHNECQVAKRQPTDRESYRQLQAAGTAVAAAIRIVETLPQTRRGGN
jgi:hypothetical protein